MSKLTDEQWVLLQRSFAKYHSMNMRLGQSYMNALHDANPEVYKQITGTNIDPFYDDGVLVQFINYLKQS